MPYRAPVEEYRFLLHKVVGLDQVTATERFADATEDVTAAILTEAGKMELVPADEVHAKLQSRLDSMKA